MAFLWTMWSTCSMNFRFKTLVAPCKITGNLAGKWYWCIGSLIILLGWLRSWKDFKKRQRWRLAKPKSWTLQGKRWPLSLHSAYVSWSLPTASLALKVSSESWGTHTQTSLVISVALLTATKKFMRFSGPTKGMVGSLLKSFLSRWGIPSLVISRHVRVGWLQR